MNPSDFLWCERFRPQTIQDCVLPARIKDHFQSMVDRKTIENSTLVSGPGTGKTTLATALCKELDIDYLLINASEQSGIDTIRTKVKSFASSVSFKEGIKCIILDESDYLSSSSQPALRGMIEEFHKNCRFIFTANFENRIIEPLKSRCPVVDFNFTKAEKKRLIIEFDKRVKSILNELNIEYDKSELAQVIIKNFPDFRKTLNLLQRFTHTGKLEVTSSTGIQETIVLELIEFIKDKDFSKVRAWLAANSDIDYAVLRRDLYQKAFTLVHPQSIPQLILHINKYDVQESQVVDREINMLSMMIEIIADIDWR